MKTVIEFARQVKLPYDYVTGEPLYLAKLEAFAALVRADALAARTAVPDAIGPNEDELPSYAAGWNDCRALMLSWRSK